MFGKQLAIYKDLVITKLHGLAREPDDTLYVIQLVRLERRVTHEPGAVALGRNDDTVRLVVDRALSTLYPSPEFETLYLKWFGEPDDATKAFFQMIALPE